MYAEHGLPFGRHATYTRRYPNFRNQGIIEPLPSQLKEVYTRYLCVIVEGKLDIV